MSVKKEKEEINGKTYLCIQWDADTAFEMKFRIAGMISGSLESILSVVGTDSEDDKAQGAAIGSAFNKLFKGNAPKDVLSLLKDVVCSCRIVDGKEGTKITQAEFPSLFQGDLLTPYKIFLFVLKVNYLDFLEESVDMSKLKGKLKSLIL